MMASGSIKMSPVKNEVEIVAKAVCTFLNGETREFYVTRFSPFDLFVMALRPPPIGTPLTVHLCPFGLQTLPPIQVRVTSTNLDHLDAGKCGFGATITELDKDTLDLIVLALDALGLSYQAVEKRPLAERRADLRIRTDFSATVVIPGRRLSARMVDLSMSGARLEFGKDALAAEIVAGTLFSIGINAGSHPEGFSLKAEAVHRISGGNTICVGVRFLDVDAETSSRIERIILDTIGRIDADGTRFYSKAI